MSLQQEIVDFLAGKGQQPFGAIKYGTSGQKHSNSVIYSALDELIKQGDVDSPKNQWYKLTNSTVKPLISSPVAETFVPEVNIDTKEAVQEQVKTIESGGLVLEQIKPVVVNDHLVKEKVTEIYGTQTKYLIAPNGVKKLPVDPLLYQVPQTVQYVPRNGELLLLKAHLESSLPLLLKGPKGIAKTLMVMYFAHINKLPLITVNCHSQIDSGDLLGRFVLHEKETPFIMGAMPKAIMMANKMGAAVIALEEFNAMTNEAQKMTNSFLDFRHDVTLNDTDEIYRLEEGKKLLIVGTMNYGTGYGGIFEINEECQSRFWHVDMGYDTPEHETKTLTALTKLEPKMIQQLVQFANATRSDEANLAFKLSTRELVNFGYALDAYRPIFPSEKESLRAAFKSTIADRYTIKEDKDWIHKQIKSYFAVDVGGMV